MVPQVPAVPPSAVRAGSCSPSSCHTACVRLTEFWRRMALVFGDTYARSWAADVVVPELDGRTVDEALAAGDSAKDVWRAVCRTVEVPPSLR